MIVPVFLGCSWSRYSQLYKKGFKFLPDTTLTSLKRCFATQNPDTMIMNVFDRKAKRLQKDRTALMKDYKVYDYIKEEIGYRTFDRICDIKRNFDVVVDLGCGRGYVSKHLQKEMVKTLYQCDNSELVLEQCENPEDIVTHRLVVDEEFIPFKENYVDLYVSSLSLHWVNDLPGCFRQIHNSLKNDGAFLGCMFGGDTLFELRVSLQLAETELEGDVDEISITYPGIKELMYDLKGMGENNCSWSRKPMLHRNTIKLADVKYKEMYGNDQGIPATYQIINFIGWKPDPSQPKAAARGSGQVSIKDLDKLDDMLKDKKDPEK